MEIFVKLLPLVGFYSLGRQIGMIINWSRTTTFSLQSIRKFAASIQEVVTLVNDNRFVKAEMREMIATSKRTGVLAFKRGMMSHYDKWGYRHPVTVLDVQH